MHSRNMSADNDKVQTFYPKFWWRFLMVLPGGSLFIGFGLFAEFMMKPNNIRKGGGYAIAAICAGIMVYMLLMLMNEKLVIDQNVARVVPIFEKCATLATPKSSCEWEKVAVIRQTRHGFGCYDFYTSSGEICDTIWYGAWRHSKQLKAVLTEHVLTHGGRFEVEPPCPHVPFTKRLTAAISKALDAIKAQFMSR